ncbi:MAG: MmcQ/YjbR family DNA-binding protein [Bacteroidota bacterium]
MNIEDFRNYCIQLPGTTEETPFGPDVLVLKVMGKMYALCSISNFESINLKCDPERAVLLREQHDQIIPGYHMNKTHWNTVMVDGLSDTFIIELINHSYTLVKDSLPKKLKDLL